MSKKSSKSKHRGGKKVINKNNIKPIIKNKINPNKLINKIITDNNNKYTPNKKFEDFPLNEKFKTNLIKKGYIEPTEIQEKTFDYLLDRKDVLGISHTGSGKTGAYLIPIIERAIRIKKKPFAIIIVPTRELALQINNEFKSITKGLKLYSACFIGGTNINKDIQNLRRPNNFLIGTPRRILELLKHKVLDIRDVNTLILDEFDKMLSLGFLKEIEYITGAMHRRQHTVLFSATLDKKSKNHINNILYNYKTVKTTNINSTVSHIYQDIVKYSKNQDKFDKLINILEENKNEKILIFEDTKIGVEELSEKLKNNNYNIEYIHGDLEQKKRLSSIKKYINNQSKILVATDVVARGIDVSDINLVINYQTPNSYNQYIHRIGRTARKGNKGKAYTFISDVIQF